MASRLALMGGVLLCAAPLAMIGCGSDGGGDADAGAADANSIDSMPPDAAGLNVGACPSSYGPAGVAATFQVSETGMGIDIDNDTNVDNQLGSDTGLRAVINMSLSNSLDDGSFRNLDELRDFGGLGGDDTDLDVVIFGGIDNDSPANLADDFNGDEDYYYARDWVLEADCAPKGIMPGSFTSGVLTAHAETTTFYIETLGGFVTFLMPTIEATIEADTVGLRTPSGTSAKFGGAIPICALNNAPANLIGDSALEEITRLFGMVHPDKDMDNDGLEVISWDNNADPGDQLVCTDGDQVTVVRGSDCGCDPRFADAYSISFDIDLRGATVLGPAPEQ